VEKREVRMLAITGMTCNGCAAAVTRVLSRVPGVANVEVDLAGARGGRGHRRSARHPPCGRGGGLWRAPPLMPPLPNG
jgi:hypothetical protein